MLVKIKKIYHENGVAYIDIRHYIVLKCLLNKEGVIAETPEGNMELTTKQLSNPIILSKTTMLSKFGGRYCLFSYRLALEKGLEMKELFAQGVFG